MADTTYLQDDLVLIEGGVLKIREYTDANTGDWQIISSIFEPDVQFTRIGGESKSFTSGNGDTKEIPAKADSWESSEIKIWVPIQTAIVMGLGFGTPVEGGTGPYTYTFTGNATSKVVDVNWKNSAFEDSAKHMEINAQQGTMTVSGFGVESEGKVEMKTKFKFGGQNFQPIMHSDTQLSTS